MEASFTANESKRSARRRSTARVFLGPRYERIAEVFCRRLGYRTLKRNVRFSGGEIDLVCVDLRTQTLVVVEVRGRELAEYRPRDTLSPAKQARLVRFARSGACGMSAYRRVRVEFIEVIGRLPRNRVLRWVACHRPTWFGIVFFRCAISEPAEVNSR